MRLLLPLAALFLIPFQAPAQASLYDGSPTFEENIGLAYYLWRDGDTWHLRWITKGRARAFDGSVRAEGGKLKSLKRVDVSSEAKTLYPGKKNLTVTVGRPGDYARAKNVSSDMLASRDATKAKLEDDTRITFTSRLNDDFSGIDFKVEESVTTLYFALNVDKDPAPDIVFGGKSNHMPRSTPLVITLK